MEQSERCALNIAAALERVEGDRALLEELLRLFADECQVSMRQIQEAWNSGDVALLGRLAHTLKGSSANVGANGVSEAAHALEREARSKKMESAAKLIADLEREIERFICALDNDFKLATD
ncbi:MAG TPA: Hpt domain-containing protein [Candidatus Acidoferrum sp.]|nr:Hpt domain-containing protein [Candidatus Acidoferrum sp.]